MFYFSLLYFKPSKHADTTISMKCSVDNADEITILHFWKVMAMKRHFPYMYNHVLPDDLLPGSNVDVTDVSL